MNIDFILVSSVYETYEVNSARLTATTMFIGDSRYNIFLASLK